MLLQKAYIAFHEMFTSLCLRGSVPKTLRYARPIVKYCAWTSFHQMTGELGRMTGMCVNLTSDTEGIFIANQSIRGSMECSSFPGAPWEEVGVKASSDYSLTSRNPSHAMILLGGSARRSNGQYPLFTTHSILDPIWKLRGLRGTLANIGY